MKITKINITKVAIPLRAKLGMGIDKELTYTSAAILEVETDEGVVGISESPFDPGRTEFELSRLASRYIGADPFDIERLVGYDPFIGELYKTVSAIEIACWDIIGKKTGLPVYKLLGGRVWERVPITAFMSFDEPDKIAAAAVEAVKSGINTIKLKLGLDAEQDVAIVKTVREAIGYGPKIRIDPNQAWSVPTAISLMKRMEKYDLQYVEQPIPKWDHDGLLKLSQKTGIPICICEGLTSLPELMRLIKARAIDFISTDPIRMGGLLGFKKVCGIAEAEGIPIIAHVTTFGISVATWLHAVISSNPTMYAHDIMYPGLNHGVWAPVGDIISEKFQDDQGFLDVPQGPGLGVSIDRAALDKWAGQYQNILGPESTNDRLIERFGKENAPTTYFMPPRY